MMSLAYMSIEFMAASVAALILIFVLPAPYSYAQAVQLEGDRTLFRLVIPKIHVDAALESVGLTPAGAMGVPAGPADAAWFDLGPRPGESGSAVIAGHYGWKNGISAVFDHLNAMRRGDRIYIRDATGTTTFIVSGVRTYGEHDDASGVFVSSDGKAHLNLITCGGIWNKALKSYSYRLIVFTDKE